MRYTMSRQRIEHTATTSADPTAVYALLRDGATWPVWGKLDSFELERPGEGEPEGLGAVRIFRQGKVEGRDTVAELVENRRFSYTHESKLPVKNYRADIDLTPRDGGTEIRWVSQFDPKYPGHGRARPPRAGQVHRRERERARRLRGARTDAGPGSNPVVCCTVRPHTHAPTPRSRNEDLHVHPHHRDPHGGHAALCVP